MNNSELVEYVAFARVAREAVVIILDSRDQAPIVSGPPAPKDWPETQAMLRNAADGLMLCRDVRIAVEKLREYPPALLLLPLCLTEIEDAALVKIMQSAFFQMSGKSVALPGEAIATFLLEIAKGDNPPVFRKDWTQT